jgi:hypothetical protein
MSLAEILEELPKLSEEERHELRSRLDEHDPGFLAVSSGAGQGHRIGAFPAKDDPVRGHQGFPRGR